MKTAYKPQLSRVDKAFSVSLFDAVTDLFKQSWYATIAGWRQIGLIWVIVILGAGAAIGIFAGSVALELYVLGFVIGGLVGTVSFLWFCVVMTRAVWAAVEGRQAEWDELHKDIVMVALRFIGGTIAYMAIVFAGLLLFVVPGIVWYYMFSQYLYAIIIDGKPVGDALRASKDMTKGRKLNIAVVMGMAIGFWVAVQYAAQFIGMMVDFSLVAGGVETYGIATMILAIPVSFLLTPLTYAVSLMVYKSLKK